MNDAPSWLLSCHFGCQGQMHTAAATSKHCYTPITLLLLVWLMVGPFTAHQHWQHASCWMVCLEECLVSLPCFPHVMLPLHACGTAQATCPVCSKLLTIDLSHTSSAAGGAAAANAASTSAAAAAGATSSKVGTSVVTCSSVRYKASSILARIDR